MWVKLKMSEEYGIKISKPGFDAETCTDEQLILGSHLAGLKVEDYGTFSITLPANEQSWIESIVVRHDLGYTPMFYLIGDGIDSSVSPVTVDTSKVFVYPFSGWGVNITIYADDVYVYADLYCSTIAEVSTSDRTWTGVYYLFYNPFGEI